MTFDYDLAFSRNLGWVSRQEQKIISQFVVAIPGMGGVGGHHLHSLARTGFRRFKIADFDDFEVHNFNRQIGAKISTLGTNKATAMKNMILDIIPDAEIEVYTEGVNDSNIDQFLESTDLVVDGLDVYVIRERIRFFDKAICKGVPVMIAGPLGMGTSGIIFKGNGISFSKYCNINEEMSEKQLVCRFLAALAPRAMHIKYLYHKNEIDMANGKAPSIHAGVLAATTFVATETLKIALKRTPIRYTPWSTQYDFYLRKCKNIWRPFGNRNPIQRLLIFVLEYMWDKYRK